MSLECEHASPVLLHGSSASIGLLQYRLRANGTTSRRKRADYDARTVFIVTDPAVGLYPAPCRDQACARAGNHRWAGRAAALERASPRSMPPTSAAAASRW